MDPRADHLRRPVAALATLARSGRAAVAHLADAVPLPLSVATDALRGAAFWTAVVLPFVHLPLLLAVGLTASTTTPLVALWTLHAVALVVGAAHAPRGSHRGQGAEDEDATVSMAVAGD